MNKREFIKSGLGLAGMSLLKPGDSLASLEGMAPFELPKLPYSYNSLEPWLDARTMEIHHSKHHAAYVEKLNAEISKGKFEYTDLTDLLKKYAGSNTIIRNHGGGHFNHTLLWRTLGKPSDDGNRMPQALEKELIETFGSLDNFKAKLFQAAMDRFGSGWAWLCKNESGKLIILSTPNQDNPLMNLSGIEKGRPILGIDVWEHAYYLKFYNKRKDYLEAFWQVINWQEAEKIRNEI
jgi:Fe-Mn family superoxide dismutase